MPKGCIAAPKMAWSQVRETVAEVLAPPDGLILFCGMSIGYEAPAVKYARTALAPLDETVTFIDNESPGLSKAEHSPVAASGVGSG